MQGSAGASACEGDEGVAFRTAGALRLAFSGVCLLHSCFNIDTCVGGGGSYYSGVIRVITAITANGVRGYSVGISITEGKIRKVVQVKI